MLRGTTVGGQPETALSGVPTGTAGRVSVASRISLRGLSAAFWGGGAGRPSQITAQDQRIRLDDLADALPHIVRTHLGLV